MSGGLGYARGDRSAPNELKGSGRSYDIATSLALPFSLSFLRRGSRAHGFVDLPRLTPRASRNDENRFSAYGVRP